MAPEAGEEKDQDEGTEDKDPNNLQNGDPNNGEAEEEEEEDEEPRLKYASLTKSLRPVYRNGDATSAFLVAGDKMIIGTHNGNINVLSLPSFQSLRANHAHSASITSISVSPFLPPLLNVRLDSGAIATSEYQSSPRPSSAAADATSASRSPRQVQVPNTPSNAIYIATSSIDGNVCVCSLMDQKDVLLRDFGRPVQAVALSPDYKNDRTYLSGGLAGNLVLTVGGLVGKSSTSNTVGGAAMSASGWLSSIGLGSNAGNDTILHSGEGTISTIKWSSSSKYVVWVNEQGIKIMRSHLHLDSTESDFSWKRINHIDRPDRPGWEEMAGLWKARVQWVNEAGLEADDVLDDSNTTSAPGNLILGSKERRVEQLVVGWGGTIWIIKVYPGNFGVGKEVGERKVGRAQVVTILRTDCIISGVSLYTPNLLLVLAYITPEENDRNGPSKNQMKPRRGVHRRQNALQPEMRIIDITTKEEVCVADTLNVSRFESLSATDYHLDVLPATRSMSRVATERGTLEAIGAGIWDATMYPTRLFSSAASIRSTGSGSERDANSKVGVGFPAPNLSAIKTSQVPHPTTLTQGMKIFIHSPYDCVLATKPTRADHMSWLNDHDMFEEAWKLLDQHPDAVGDLPDTISESSSTTPTKVKCNPNDLTRAQGSLIDFFADDSSQATTSGGRDSNPQIQKEKRKVGERWVNQLVSKEEWRKAGETCGRVLDTSTSWEHWFWIFAHKNQFQEITPYLPITRLLPPLSSQVYEIALSHYISHDRLRLKELLDRWSPELFDVRSVITALQGRLKAGDIREDTFEEGDQGRDWRILLECVAKLYLSEGRSRDALKCYIRLQDAQSAMNLISEYHLIDALSDDIPGLILLRVSKEQQKSAQLPELEEATSEPIRLLVNAAYDGIVPPQTVISQLQNRPDMLIYLFFYFRALWTGDTTPTAPTTTSDQRSSSPSPRIHSSADHLATTDGRAILSPFADVVLPIFATYSRPLLLSLLKTSQSYTLDLATQICQERHYTPELIYLLSKEGRTKDALALIIHQLADVSQAIAFAKEQNDPDLWDDLLTYSMNKPLFIKALLEEVGTAINPIALVRRIPAGLEIEGLREGLSRMIKEFEIQDSISEGVARVLRGEVAIGMAELRTGQKKGLKFAVVDGRQHEHAPKPPPSGRQDVTESEAAEPEKPQGHPKHVKPGHCAGCGELLVEDEKQYLVAFPCNHVFHLSCLVTYNDDGLEDAEALQAAIPADEPPNPWERSIGGKVKYAERIHGRVHGGCPLPVHKSEA